MNFKRNLEKILLSAFPCWTLGNAEKYKIPEKLTSIFLSLQEKLSQKSVHFVSLDLSYSIDLAVNRLIGTTLDQTTSIFIISLRFGRLKIVFRKSNRLFD